MSLCQFVLNRFVVLLAASVTCIFVTNAQAAPADLTRHLANHVQPNGPPLSSDDTFFGTEGTARLIVHNGNGSDPATKVTAGSIVINGREILGPYDFQHATDRLEVPIQLLADDNSISVSLNCGFPKRKSAAKTAP